MRIAGGKSSSPREAPQAFFFQNLAKTSPAGSESPAQPATAPAPRNSFEGKGAALSLKGGRSGALGGSG
jgi:hypothetical protein